MAATSGTINTVTVTRLNIITDALQDLRQLSDGGVPTAGDLTDCARKLNMLLKKWAIKGRLLWCLDTIVVPCQANKTVYAIGPTGDVVTYRPLRAFNSSFVRLVTGGQNIDTPLIVFSKLEYDQMSNKGVTGVPNSVYYDPQMTLTPNAGYDPSQSNGQLYVFVTPLDATRTIYLKVQRPIQDINNDGDTFDMPLEWYETLTKNLAAAVADKYEIPENRIMRIKNEAKESLDELSDWGATEQASMFFQPLYEGGDA
ncbi:MAG: hypothetical protein ACREO5_00110 [Candidatus Binatia bacterium]